MARLYSNENFPYNYRSTRLPKHGAIAMLKTPERRHAYGLLPPPPVIPGDIGNAVCIDI